MIKTNILLFYLDQVGKMFSTLCCKKNRFLPLSCLCVLHFSNKVISQSSIPCGNLEHKVNENASVVNSVFLLENIDAYFYNY